MEIKKKEVMHIYNFEVHSSRSFTYGPILAHFQIHFLNKEFNSCNYSFTDIERGADTYTRDQWRVLKLIEEKIIEIEAQYAAEQK